MDYYQKTLVARAVLYAVAVLGTFVVLVLSFRSARRQKDPARWGFVFIRVALFFTILAWILAIVNAAMVVVLFGDDFRGDFRKLNLANQWVTIVMLLFENLGDINVFLALASLRSGISVVHRGKARTHVFIIVAALFSVVLTLMALARFIMDTYLYAKLDWSIQFFDNFRDHYRRLIWMFMIFIFVTSVAMVVVALLAQRKTRGSSTSTAGTFLLAASLLWFFSKLYMIIINGIYTPFDPENDYDMIRYPVALNAVEVVLYSWPVLGVFVLFYLLGKKKRNGLWLGGKHGYGAEGQNPAVQHYV